MDWKKKAEKLFEEQKHLEEKRALEDGQRRQEMAELERKKKLTILQSQFKCHICGKLPSGPYVPSIHNIETGMWDDGNENWTEPGNLAQCSFCHEWTCFEHLHKGVCQMCAEKL